MAFLFDSLIPIFENHEEKKQDRLGSEQRLQLEGDSWQEMLQLWLDNPDEIAAFLEREGTSQGRAEPKPGGQGSRPGTKKARTLSQEPLEADYPIKAKLEMGLDILKFLTERIHFAALNSFPLKEEPG